VKLCFPKSQILDYSEMYPNYVGERDKKLTEDLTQKIFLSYKSKGYLTQDEFLTVCSWKTQRSKRLCESNDEILIREISTIARKVETEQLRIQIWTILSGVGFPTASVFLHFTFNPFDLNSVERGYPILDRRALWSLQTDVPGFYTFKFWWDYVNFCRKLAKDAKVSMRDLDKALWTYSKVNQK